MVQGKTYVLSLDPKYLLGSTDVRAVELLNGVNDGHAERQSRARYFNFESTERFTVATQSVKPGEPSRLPLTVDVPAGRVGVYVTDIYGRPDAAVLKSLNLTPSKDPLKQVWLTAPLIKESQWLPRLLDVSNWNYYGKQEQTSAERIVYYGYLLQQTHSVKPGEKLRVSFRKPNEARKSTADNDRMNSSLKSPAPDPIIPKFATPETLMQHFADCQMRGDTVGCLDSYSDEVINGFASSYLMTAMIERGELYLSNSNKSQLEPDPMRQQFRNELETLLKNAVIENPPAIASVALQQAAGSYFSDNDSKKRDALTNDQLALIATSPTMLKDPRQFVKDFALWAAANEDEQSKKPLPTNRQYRIEYDGDAVWSVNEEDNSRMELKRFGDTWLIHEPWGSEAKEGDAAVDEQLPVKADGSERFGTVDELQKSFQREVMPTDRTKQILELTVELAKKNNQVPKLLHLLSAVLRNNGPAAVAVVEVLEHKETTLKELIRQCDEAATSADANTAIEWTQIRNAAESTARQWKHDYLSAEHLMMALMVDGTTTNQFLRQQGIEPAVVSDMLVRMVFAPPGPLAPVVPTP